MFDLIEQVFGAAKTRVECRPSEEFELGDKARRGTRFATVAQVFKSIQC